MIIAALGRCMQAQERGNFFFANTLSDQEITLVIWIPSRGSHGHLSINDKDFKHMKEGPLKPPQVSMNGI